MTSTLPDTLDPATKGTALVRALRRVWPYAYTRDPRSAELTW